jgi:transposase-like protein
MVAERSEHLGAAPYERSAAKVGYANGFKARAAAQLDFLSDLKARGLQGIELIVSDAHEGLKAARKAVFPSVAWA